MKKIIPIISTYLRLSLVLVILFSLVANGAFAGQRVEKQDKVGAESIDEAQLLQGPPSPDELPLNMQKTNKPETEQMAYLKNVQVVKTDNNESKYKLNKEQSKQILKEFLNSHLECVLVSTTSQVHSKLGRQFRLIGAKPSGTS